MGFTDWVDDAWDWMTNDDSNWGDFWIGLEVIAKNTVAFYDDPTVAPWDIDAFIERNPERVARYYESEIERDNRYAREQVDEAIRNYFGDTFDNWEALSAALQLWDVESLDGESGIPFELKQFILRLEYIKNVLTTTDDGVSLFELVRREFPQIDNILEEYSSWKSRQLSTIENILRTDKRSYEEKLSDLFSKPGEEQFTLATDFITTSQDTVTQIIRDNTRENVAPKITLPYELSIGLSKFAVPPLSISLSSDYKVTSMTGGAIRQPNSPKFNTGHSETYINVTLYFPNHDSIWGYEGQGEFDIDFDNDSEEIIDYYMSSLRGLVTAFKFSPFLPIKNTYLNSTFDITGVGLHSMTVQSLEGFPFVLAVNLTLVKFNHKPFLPMIRDFNQAIHWGKYRQYCGKAATSLAKRVEKGFLLAPDLDDFKRYYDGVSMNGPGHFADDFMFDESGRAYQLDLDQAPSYQNNNLMSKVQKDTFNDLRHFQLYYPKNAISKVYAPDMSGFRTPYEDFLFSFDSASSLWDQFVSNVAGIDIQNFIDLGDAPTYQDVVLYSKSSKADEGKMSDIQTIFAWLDTVDRIKNETATGELFQEYFDYYKEQIIPDVDDEEILLNEKINVQRDWLTILLFQFQEQPYIKQVLEDQSGIKDDSFFKEWEVPMEKMELDWDHVHINGISVTMGNNIVRHQLQMQEDPVHQHIGGRDTQVNVSMTVTGESQLIAFRRVFSHINGLARLEHAKGVIGFFGIKNTITALCGVKYVLPLSFEVNTVPGYPHVYQVNMSLTDFDIFQQKREILNSDQQKQLIDMFGKRNPFLRIKQYWGASNNYPDLPLEIQNSEGNIVGYHDPDYYFRAFQTLDDDLVSFEQETIITDNSTDNTYDELLAAGGEPITSIEHLNTGQGESALIATKDVYERFTVSTNLGAYDDEQKNQFFVDINGARLDMYEQDFDSNQIFNENRDLSLMDDVAENNVFAVQPGTTGFAEYQGSYLANDPLWKTLDNKSYSSDYEANQFESIMKDAQYRGTSGGRMLNAFPTYMLWLIDEGGTFAGTKLFDNFYGLNSVIDFSVVQSEDILGDTLVLRVSNMYQKLTRDAQNFLSYDSQQDATQGILALDNLRNEAVNRWRHMVDDPPLFYQDLNNIRLKPGVRLHLRAGYGSNPNSLDTIFNGIVTEVQQGDIVTIIAQSDAIELSAYVNTENEDGHSGKIDGAMSTGLFLSEPRDLMVKLLTMGTNTFREQIARASRGVIFSESKYGIRHFGSILYEPLSEREERLQEQKIKAVGDSLEVGSTNASVTDIVEGVSSLAGAYDDQSLSYGEDFIGNLYGTVFFNPAVAELSKTMWVNLFRSRDYEIFKRNIYPGNGTGIMQFAGIDTLDAASVFTAMRKTRDRNGKEPTLSEIDRAYLYALANASETVLDKGYSWGELVDAGLTSAQVAQLAPLFNIEDPNNNGTSNTSNDVNYESDTNSDSGFSGFLNRFSISNFRLGANIIADVFRGPYTQGSYHPLYDLFGLTGELDDDLYGYDEISFRAQTYMRTIWDLCKICAAMQPNYIVAVRPFEDRSTLFYGKPHWLYTSGVIPLTTGIPKSRELNIASPDETLRKILAEYSLEKNSEATRQKDQQYLLGVGRGIEDPYLTPHGVQWDGGLGTNVAQLPVEIFATDSQGNPNVNEPIASLPMDPNGDGPKRKVKAKLEMHLPTTANRYGEPSRNDGHMQHPQLPARYKYPRYMDRKEGGVGGVDRILRYGEGLEGEFVTLEGDVASNSGQPGAFDYLDPLSEQYYIAARWPYRGAEELLGLEQNTLRHSIEDYRGRKILVYSEKYNRACIVTPGDWGPHGSLPDRDIGLSPDAMHWLTLDEAENRSHMGELLDVYYGFVDDKYRLGPVHLNDSFATQVEVINPADGSNSVSVSNDPIISRSDIIDKLQIYLDNNLDDITWERIQWLTEGNIPEVNDSPIGSQEDFANISNFKEWALDYYSGSVDAFINRFGWAFELVSPIINSQDDTYWVDADSNRIGEEVEYLTENQIYSIDGAKISAEDSLGIWDLFRKHFPEDEVTIDKFLEPYPEGTISGNSIQWVEAQDNYPDGIQTWPEYRNMVGEFMHFMWVDPYRRAWLVVTTDVKGDFLQTVDDGIVFVGDAVIEAVTFGNDTESSAEDNIESADPQSIDFSSSPVSEVWKIFANASPEARATFNSGLTYLDQGSPATIMDAFMVANDDEGEKSSNYVTRQVNKIVNWFDENLISVVDGIGSLISSVITTYRLQMASMNLNLAQTGMMQIQANIMNKVLNDSIYYDPSISDPLIRFADNAFTREYGEPVIEVREPFQRMHYLSSFTNIISNNIFETTNDVNTVITATSDGKYPVTVFFDKGAPSNMQKEGAVESGIFWDNARSSGFFSFLHPILNPLETYRGLYKDVTNSTDEMLSKRIALSHLRENLQDIYDGELTILGNTSIRPHDLVYLSDIYEQMYGMFEVEEIVHHFTPDMGFISTVKPNALVTVNDPARWAFTSLMRAKLGVKDVRDTVRNTIDLKADGISQINRSNFAEDMESIHQTLRPIAEGNIQYTAGRSALINDMQSRANSGFLLFPQRTGSQTANLQTGNEGAWSALLAAAGFISLPIAGIAAGVAAPGGAIAGSVAGSATAGGTAALGNAAFNNDALRSGFSTGVATFIPFADFVYDAWDWVQENLKDQQGCYISYLNKNGQPMDAGLAYNQGVAVGHWYSKSILPGLLISTTRIRNPRGRVRITYDDLLESLGWNEIDISGVVKRTSWYVDQINAKVLQLSGFGPDPVTVGRPLVAMVRVTRVLDGDTFDFEYVGESLEGDQLNADVLELMPRNGQMRLRFSGINTPEMSYYNTNRDYEGEYLVPSGTIPFGAAAKEYVINVLNPNQQNDERTTDGRIVAIRLDPSNLYDNTDNPRLLGVIFHTVPEGTSDEDTLQVLYDLASQSPIIPWDSYHSDGRPYTLNWELVIKGYADVSLAAMQSGVRDGRDQRNTLRGDN